MGYCEIMINNFAQGRNFGGCEFKYNTENILFSTKLYLNPQSEYNFDKYYIFKDQTQVDLFFW